ncbi:Dimerisation domain-containing protein [Pseudonocardia thermophila]|jgi:O-methyltransferase.|uniref:Dimerisation domain-containing protein n=1 Tax=Pseudonocardia thermophila TaxID=1848 RepID=A0A1M6Z284_PSETH|nr:methyltransferase [Pseudonocardia thermophila]SHL24493.1 Dimerisation domain-containing protein [Pseudonocardia thermophila]
MTATTQNRTGDRNRVLGMLWGFFPAQVLRTAAALGLPELMVEPRTAAELARLADTDPGATHRLLTAMVGLRLATRDGAGRFALTADGELLRPGSPGGLGGLAQLFCGDATWRAWGELPASVRGGDPALPRITGSSTFDAIAADPLLRAVFTEAMAEGTRMVAADVAAACDLDGVRTLVDVGGGNGTLLAAFLAAHPGLHGILFDLPDGIGDAARVLPPGAEIVTGDVFEAVPAADAHVLKSVLHDWPDERAVAVLRSVRAAMPERGRLFVVEPTLPADPAALPDAYVTLMSDLNMLVCTGGRERTSAEFAELLAAAGLVLTDERPLPPPSSYRVLRAVPA